MLHFLGAGGKRHLSNSGQGILTLIDTAREPINPAKKPAGIFDISFAQVLQAGKAGKSREKNMATPEHQVTRLLRDFTASAINEMLFRVDVRKEERYFGEFPYPDRETGRPRLEEVLSLTRAAPRDLLLKAAEGLLATGEFPGVSVSGGDDPAPLTPFRHDFRLAAAGPEIGSNLDAAVALGRFVQAMNEKLFRMGYRDLPGAVPAPRAP
jgi:hypothetical protein